MTRRILLLSFFFLFLANYSFAQKKKKNHFLINGEIRISKYHTLEELNRLNKGQLLNIYIERIKVLVNVLPNIAFATKPDVTMAMAGVPETKDNIKVLEANHEASKIYFASTVKYQRTILPYSDTRDLIAAIMFYEQNLKSLHLYKDYNKN